MSQVTVLALQGAPAPADALRVSVPELGTGPLVARLCARISELAPAGSLVLVASGADCTLLPAVSVAQRAARRQVLGYVLITPGSLDVTDAWPDARVAVIGDENIARLRGWDSIEDIDAWIASR